MVDVKVPVLAESVSEATLMKWHKKQGDVVKRGDNLIDIETDKVTLEVAALNDGVLSEILKGDGELVQSDEVIARISTEEKSAKTVEQKKPAAPEQQSLAVDNVVDYEPKTSPAVRNVLSENNLKPSDIPDSNADGRITKEDVVNYLGNVEQSDTSSVSVETKNTETEIAPVQPIAESRPEPIEQAVPVIQNPASIPAPEVKPVTALNTNAQGRPEEKVAMSRLRQRTAERLMAAQHENAILTTFNEVNMKPVMNLRSLYKLQFEKEHGVKLGFMSFFTKATTEALKKFPIINASIDGKDIVYHGYFDIGIAVSAPRGLVVPIIRNADSMSLAEIEKNVVEYGQKAKDSKLTIEDLTGGTFTITNGGTFGSLLSTPILNPPQSAILGMHKIQDRPMAVNGEVVILPMMYLALSYDHRIVDGRDAVQFLVTIKNLLEDPSRLLLQV
jgi:2-oxoglutarate dehydrogenase E2 component (dihydrolipoamide succinyltransferase)